MSKESEAAKLRSFKVSVYALHEEREIGLIDMDEFRRRYRELWVLYFGDEDD